MCRVILILLGLSHLGFSQEVNFISDVKNKSDRYFQTLARVKLELLFNQSRYSPGDTAYIRALYLSANDLKPVKGNQVVHVCLFDLQGAKKMTYWFLIKDGLATAKMVIPKEVVPGNYVIVAFTNWMKNLDQSLFFKKQFLIAGKNLFTKAEPKDSITVFVEGGSLIEGLENNLAIRYTGGKPQAKMVIRESGSVIAELKAANDSITTFKIRPKSNKDYSVVLYAENLIKEFKCPRVIPNGISIQCTVEKDNTKISLECSTTEEFRANQFYLLIFNNKGLWFYQPLDFSLQSRKDIMLQQNLPRGISQVVIVDSQQKMWCDRVFYLPNQNNDIVSIENLPESLSTRKQVKLNIRMNDNGGQPINGIFAFNIVRNDLVPSKPPMDYFNFTSDLSNSFELPQHVSDVDINDYLIGQKCPWFNWRRLIDKGIATTSLKQSYVTFSGKAANAANGLPLKDSTKLMFLLEKNLEGYETYTNSKGLFSFPLIFQIFSDDKFFYTANYKDKDVNEINLKVDDPDSSVTFRAEPFIDSGISDQYSIDNSRIRIINNSYSFFLNSKLANDSLYNPNKAIEDLLGGADVTLNTNEYLLMPTMVEVIKELLKKVEHRRIKGRDVVRVITTYKKPNYSGSFYNNNVGPLYVIDGQITKDSKYFLELNPKDVISIKVVSNSQRLLALGSLGANGVIIVKTSNNNVIDQKNEIVCYGLLPPSPSFSINNFNNDIPDFRFCLFWSAYSPFVATEANQIQFNTSDDVGKFALQVYGVTDEGRPLYAEKYFEVKYSD